LQGSELTGGRCGVPHVSLDRLEQIANALHAETRRVQRFLLVRAGERLESLRERWRLVSEEDAEDCSEARFGGRGASEPAPERSRGTSKRIVKVVAQHLGRTATSAKVTTNPCDVPTLARVERLHEAIEQWQQYLGVASPVGGASETAQTAPILPSNVRQKGTVGAKRGARPPNRHPKRMDVAPAERSPSRTQPPRHDVGGRFGGRT
jgi:hypothetical protein